MATKSTEQAASTPPAFGPAGAGAIGLDAVVGHDALRRFLTEGARSGTLPHALLFTGPKGVGKRTTAQALVAQRLCERGVGCGSCKECGALRRGNHPSLVTVAVPEGKSQIPIDAVKELERELSLRPPDERGRFALLLGLDRATAPAQDALLKTLEEPPAGNVLLLTAVRPNAVLPTIRSRCQRFALTPLRDEEVELVSRRLGVALTVPASVAAGCPGALVALADPQVDRLRRGVAKLLAEPRDRDDFAKWVVLLHDGLAKDAEPAQLRARARLLLALASLFVRDAVVLRASAGAAIVRNSDQRERVEAIATRPEWSDAVDSLSRLARAHDRIEGNVDPASALLCALQPAADEAARAGGR
jgi:DNA polymerase-3 subunit delta'